VNVFSLGLGFLWPLWDSRDQTFADKLASTVCVRVPVSERR
jgi:Mce-associated membrane protein